jgi:type I restriction enzyme S subunit
MNAEQLLAHFNRVADAPDAISRLRRFILDLAVRGKLVEQDPNDEPASELLKPILVSSRSSGLDVAPSAGEPPFELPQSWSWISVGQAAHVEMGQSPSSDHYNQSRDGMPFYQGKTDFGRRHPTPRYWCNRPTKIAFKGDILISVRAPVGPTNVADAECCIGRGLAALRPHPGVDPEFLLLCLKSFESVLASLGFGTTFVAINKKHLVSFPIPIPPLAEQRRIVAKVDELMALCDQLEAAQAVQESRRDRLVAASLHRLNQPTDASNDDAFGEHARFHLDHLSRLTTRSAQIKQLRQTMLYFAVIGRLTPSPQDAAAAQGELKEVEAKKRTLALRKQKALVPVSADERWCELPQGWAWARWGQITDWITYGFTRPMPHTREGIPIVTGKNVNFGKIIWESADRTTVAAYAELNEKDRPQKGDILLTKDGSIGRSAIVDTNEPFCINQSVAVLWLRSCHFDRRFLQLVIDCPQTQLALLAKTEGVAIKHISVVDFGKMALPLPPLAEQHRIVAKVDELMALCDQLESQLVAVQTESSRLLEALLHGALAEVA